MKKIEREFTEPLGFWEVDFDEKLVPYMYYDDGFYMVRWSGDHKYLSVAMPDTDCHRMFECKDTDTFNKLYEYFDSLEKPDNIDLADDAVIELVYWLANNPKFTWKD